MFVGWAFKLWSVVVLVLVLYFTCGTQGVPVQGIAVLLLLHNSIFDFIKQQKSLTDQDIFGRCDSYLFVVVKDPCCTVRVSAKRRVVPCCGCNTIAMRVRLKWNHKTVTVTKQNKKQNQHHQPTTTYLCPSIGHGGWPPPPIHKYHSHPPFPPPRPCCKVSCPVRPRER